MGRHLHILYFIDNLCAMADFIKEFDSKGIFVRISHNQGNIMIAIIINSSVKKMDTLKTTANETMEAVKSTMESFSGGFTIETMGNIIGNAQLNPLLSNPRMNCRCLQNINFIKEFDSKGMIGWLWL